MNPPNTSNEWIIIATPEDKAKYSPKLATDEFKCEDIFEENAGCFYWRKIIDNDGDFKTMLTYRRRNPDYKPNTSDVESDVESVTQKLIDAGGNFTGIVQIRGMAKCVVSELAKLEASLNEVKRERDEVSGFNEKNKECLRECACKIIELERSRDRLQASNERMRQALVDAERIMSFCGERCVSVDNILAETTPPPQVNQ